MKNILIIGCGLLGSSVLRSIHKNKLANKIFIYEKSKKNISTLKKLKLPGKVVSSLIADVGSSKIESSKIIKKYLKKGIAWTSSHPIAGSEVSGPQHGKSNMFEGRWCILIKEKNTIKKNLNFLKKFWEKIGSKVTIMSPEKHDKIFSITSHLPHLIAYNLVKSAQDFEKKQSYDLIKYSAGGLRDFSRIAASNEIMWRDIFFNNNKNISNAIDLFIKNLKSFKSDINSKNNKSIINKLTKTKKVRSKIIKLKQDINKPDFGRS